VLDTNILISARISKGGTPARLLSILLGQGFNIELLTSADLLDEVERVLQYPRIKRKYNLTDDDLTNYLRTIEEVSARIDVQSVDAIIGDDPDDDRVLACAFEGHADYVVSGDPHLLDLGEYEGIMIISPRDFLSLLGAHEQKEEQQ
jgi:uncharacterized protein